MMKPIKFIAFLVICLLFSFIIVDSIQHIRAEVKHRNGFIKKSRGYPKLAIADFKTAVDLMPWENHYRLQLAQNYEDAAKKSPNEFTKYTNLAIQEYEKLIENDSINPWFQARLGIIYYDLARRNPEKEAYTTLAQKYSKQATLNDPKNPLFTMHYAHFLWTTNDYEMAKKYYKKTIAYDNDLTEAHFNLGSIYFNENDIVNGIKHYKIVEEHLSKMEKDPGNTKIPETKRKMDRFQSARIVFTEFLIKSNKAEEAYAMISKIPESVERYDLLAQYFEKTNRKNQALNIYTQLKNNLKNDRYDEKIKQLSK